MDEKDTRDVPDKSLLEQNHSFAYVQAKAERLATAAYLVSQFISDEPLRAKIRTCALDLLSSVNEDGAVNMHAAVLNIVRETTSLLNVAYRTGYVSDMNWSLLNKEYGEFAAVVREQAGNVPAHGMTLSKKLFDTGASLPEPTPHRRPERTSIPKTSIKDKRTFKGQERKQSAAAKGTVTSDRKNERRTAIFDLLKKQKKVTVRDVANAVPGVSEKTLQRELVGLVEEGALKREGERRWSTYSLADS